LRKASAIRWATRYSIRLAENLIGGDRDCRLDADVVSVRRDTPPEVEPPPVQYLRAASGRVAYQTWGEGDTTLLWLSNWATSVDNIWEHPARVRFVAFHGTLARVVRFDPRGQGASDPLPAEDDVIQGWVSDAEAVLDALACADVTVVAELLAAHVGLRLAARSTHRVGRLALWNSWLGPISSDRREAAALAGAVAADWGSGQFTRTNAPTLLRGAEPGFFGRTERLGASPMAAEALMFATLTSRVDDLAPAVHQPALVIHSGDIPAVSAQWSGDLAAVLSDVELRESRSASFYWGEDMATYAEFLGGHGVTTGERDFGAIMFTDIVGSTLIASRMGDDEWRRLLDQIDDFVATEVHRRGGSTVKHTGDGHLMTFPSPASAVVAGRAITRGVEALGVTMRAGIHVGEFERRRIDDIAGVVVHVAARVASQANAGEVLVSRTVVDLVAGRGFAFDDRGTRPLKGLAGDWQLLAVVDT
jgi:class 3 adenylate cyclase